MTKKVETIDIEISVLQEKLVSNGRIFAENMGINLPDINGKYEPDFPANNDLNEETNFSDLDNDEDGQPLHINLLSINENASLGLEN